MGIADPMRSAKSGGQPGAVRPAGDQRDGVADVPPVKLPDSPDSAANVERNLTAVRVLHVSLRGGHMRFAVYPSNASRQAAADELQH
jgi:hypothetical protein